MIDKTTPVQGYYRKMSVHKAKSKTPGPYNPGSRVLQYVAAGFVMFVVSAWPTAAHAAKIMYKFNAWNGPEMRVFVTRPVGLAPDRPVVFVLHGAKRNADEYRDQWHELAIEHDFLLVVPEFSERNFPGPESYNEESVFDEQGVLKAVIGQVPRRYRGNLRRCAFPFPTVDRDLFTVWPLGRSAVC